MLSHVQLFCNPVACSPPGSSVHGFLQATILEQVAISSPGDLPDSQIKPVTCVSCIGRWVLYHSATWEACPSPHSLENIKVGFWKSVFKAPTLCLFYFIILAPWWSLETSLWADPLVRTLNMLLLLCTAPSALAPMGWLGPMVPETPVCPAFHRAVNLGNPCSLPWSRAKAPFAHILFPAPVKRMSEYWVMFIHPAQLKGRRNNQWVKEHTYCNEFSLSPGFHHSLSDSDPWQTF